MTCNETMDELNSLIAADDLKGASDLIRRTSFRVSSEMLIAYAVEVFLLKQAAK